MKEGEDVKLDIEKIFATIDRPSSLDFQSSSMPAIFI